MAEYDNGGDLPSGTVLVVNATGKPEPVYTNGGSETGGNQCPSSTDE